MRLNGFILILACAFSLFIFLKTVSVTFANIDPATGCNLDTTYPDSNGDCLPLTYCSGYGFYVRYRNQCPVEDGCPAGYAHAGDGSKSDCKPIDEYRRPAYNPVCGNGIIDKEIGEECDSGSANGTEKDVCLAGCKLKPTPPPTFVADGTKLPVLTVYNYKFEKSVSNFIAIDKNDVSDYKSSDSRVKNSVHEFVLPSYDTSGSGENLQYSLVLNDVYLNKNGKPKDSAVLTLLDSFTGLPYNPPVELYVKFPRIINISGSEASRGLSSNTTKFLASAFLGVKQILSNIIKLRFFGF